MTAYWKRATTDDMGGKRMASNETRAKVRRIIDDGYANSLGLESLTVPRCEAVTPARLYKDEGLCPYEAKFKTIDGKRFCQIHAELWAAAKVGEALPS